jgi:sterol desaturase/sphingolipid hydroxylase (fatty acid hydroxylase superfamily)
MEELVPVVILASYFGLLTLERLVPARPLPAVRGWTARGLAFFFAALVVNGGVPALVAGLLGGHTLLDGAGLGVLGGAAAVFVCSELFNYWLHRSFHNVHSLWRWVHQLHHSAERVDMLGSGFVHPHEVALSAAMTTLVVAALGVTPDAAALAGMVGIFYALFQHCNVKTPVWLGYLIQRPESHSVHHARGVHAYNYANLPLFDILFGTFRNPREFVAEAGFWDGASLRVADMLRARDVGEPPVASSATSPAPMGAALNALPSVRA